MHAHTQAYAHTPVHMRKHGYTCATWRVHTLSHGDEFLLPPHRPPHHHAVKLLLLSLFIFIQNKSNKIHKKS